MDEFFYPEDRGELFGEPNEEEAWVYHTLTDFDEIVKRNGVFFVLNRISKETLNEIYVACNKEDKPNMICAILDKNAGKL
jgi:hypothetical protein